MAGTHKAAPSAQICSLAPNLPAGVQFSCPEFGREGHSHRPRLLGTSMSHAFSSIRKPSLSRSFRRPMIYRVAPLFACSKTFLFGLPNSLASGTSLALLRTVSSRAVRSKCPAPFLSARKGSPSVVAAVSKAAQELRPLLGRFDDPGLVACPLPRGTRLFGIPNRNAFRRLKKRLPSKLLPKKFGNP